jgi:Mn-dependent DtxR family transcriptional regulator
MAGVCQEVSTMNMFEQTSVSHSAAHYLMTIAELHKERGYVRAVDVAERMGISRSAAHLGLKALKAKDLIVEDERHFYRLPDGARDLATTILGNRSLLVRFFTDILGAPESEAERNACLMEHLLTDDTAHRLLAFVKTLTETSAGRRVVERFQEALLVCPESGHCELCEAYERCPLTAAFGEAEAE